MKELQLLKEIDEEAKDYARAIVQAHDCAKCHGKIIAISVDKVGNTYCGYCHEQVNYPKPSEKLVAHFKRFKKEVKNVEE